jgi:hypothetical protein
MTQTTSIADGNNPVVKSAAQDANAIQDAVNLVAIVGCFHRHLVSLAFTSKLNSLCRMTTEREMAAFSAIDKIAEGESVEYEVIPL